MDCDACKRDGRAVVQELAALCRGCATVARLIQYRAECNGGLVVEQDARFIEGVELGTVAAISRIGRGCISAKWPEIETAGRFFGGVARVDLGPPNRRRGRK
jgi:hypothetical protein